MVDVNRQSLIVNRQWLMVDSQLSINEQLTVATSTTTAINNDSHQPRITSF
ncbi:hypothetical protein H6G89_28080 [Oscillatoria sp. FACHB-1407]|uniref:hypothetical protein n=1 Tax=Oscillatoria sp. FACHB-1407 TaxID=2692847 RepID=UPI001681EDBB|nr:hypothetical protein [Oscillatoria sp. FACHB-1407]MBD2464866.1 hypothetical protein [Oscillatoria sp. FACHB-1407]